MIEASWILYMLGSSESLKWEIAQITQHRLFDKALFLFPPNLRSTGAGKKRRLRNWNHFLQAFANTELHDALEGIDESGAIAMWIGADHRIFVVRASGEFFQEYELALRIALYLKNRIGVGSLTASVNNGGPENARIESASPQILLQKSEIAR